MGISSFAAGFAQSLAEGLKEDRLRAEATAEKRYQQRAIEIKTAKQQEKKIRTELKQRVAEIRSIAPKLGPSTVAALMESPELLTEFKTLARDNPSRLQDFIKSRDENDVLDVKQRIELNAQQAYKDITGMTAPSGKTFIPGLNVDTSRIGESYAADVGMSLKELSDKQAPAPLDPLNVQVDKLLLSTRTGDQQANILENQLSQVKNLLINNPDDPELQNKFNKLEKQQIILRSTYKGSNEDDAAVRADLKTIMGIMDRKLVFQKLGQLDPNTGNLIPIGAATEDQANEIAQEYNNRLSEALAPIMRRNGLSVTGDFLKDLKELELSGKAPKVRDSFAAYRDTVLPRNYYYPEGNKPIDVDPKRKGAQDFEQTLKSKNSPIRITPGTTYKPKK